MIWLSYFNYWAVVTLMMIGFYCVIARGNMAKKIMGLNLFQTSVFILFISAGKIIGGSTPILRAGVEVYSNPLPHVLILTAIVVGVATTAVALALAVRIQEAYGSIEDDHLSEEERPDFPGDTGSGPGFAAIRHRQSVQGSREAQ